MTRDEFLRRHASDSCEGDAVRIDLDALLAEVRRDEAARLWDLVIEVAESRATTAKALGYKEVYLAAYDDILAFLRAYAEREKAGRPHGLDLMGDALAVPK